ncbi:MAG: hypothetical protein B9S32_00585 [Verrucomicrobia bacterium Tous-C9LFEB]|nr:MAG: hypothetical protein B9S32_00585 [Verrucomicrobia bacterium Tous-C9LFEB]
MKKILLSLLLAITAITFISGAPTTAEKPHSYVPPNGFVPDAATAIRIAQTVWIPIYGEKVLKQKPFIAELDDKGVWHVHGSLSEGLKGDTALAEISKKDGTILRVSHGK